MLDKIGTKMAGAKSDIEYITSGQFWDDFVMHTLLWIVAFIVILVLANTVFDKFRSTIRGLDVAFIGMAFIWFGYKVSGLPIVKGMAHPAFIIGGILAAVGIILFAVFKFLARKKKASGEEGKSSAKGLAAVILACVLALGVGFYSGQLIDLSPDKTPGGTLTAKDIQGTMEQVQELASLEYAYSNIVEYKGDALQILKKNIPFTSKYVQAQYSGVVKMGSDLKDMDISVADDGQTIHITMPHSRILSHEIDEESFVFSEVKNGILNRVKVDDTTVVRKKAKEVIEKKVADENMLLDADAKGKENISTYLQQAYPQCKVEVEFQ